MEEGDNHTLDDVPIGRPYSDDPTSTENDDFDDEFCDGNTHLSPVVETKPRYHRWLIFATCALLALAAVGAVMAVLMDSNERGPTISAMAYLESLDITTTEEFSNVESPQRKAVEWIMHRDPLKLGITDQGFVQRYIVAVVVHALHAPSSKYDMLREKLYFLSAYHECDWKAKLESKTDNTALFMGIFCDDNNRVTKIIMPTVGFTGELPKELGSLETLKKIVLDANELTGSIPYIPSLTSLSLAYNHYDGTFPSNIGLMTNLEEVILTENMFSGELPDNLRNLTRLKRFAIGGNDFKDGVHNLFRLTNLQEIYGGYNSFQDSFDNDSFGLLTSLKVLDFKNNRLEGPFPDALWTLPKLQVVDFHFNALDGHLHEIEDKFSPVLEYLDISENFLSGGLPTTLNKLTNLVYLDLSSNRFEKPLPDDYSSLTNLKALLLTDNMIGPQPIPTWLQNLTDLKHLSLKLTGRTGTIPDWFFSSLQQLEILDMDWNHISGSIPKDLGQMTMLEHLLLNRNWLEGTIPSAVSKLPNLQTIMVDNNNLIGELVVCQAISAVADCGNPLLGCPDCISETMEVSCPCCSRCCFDEDEFCNSEDWISVIVDARRKKDPMMFYPSSYRPSDYTPNDVFEPGKVTNQP